MKCENSENNKIININNPSSESESDECINKNNEYINKINEMELKIKELELQITEKDRKINDQIKKNKELNEIVINTIKELENEIKLFRKYNNFSKGEKLISIKFASKKQDIDYSIIIKNTEIFSKIETMLYNKYPKYIGTKNNFYVGDNRINRDKTFEQNNIKNNDIITLCI